MNEPASFVHGTVGGKCLGDPLLENPPYMPRKTHSILYFFSPHVVIRSLSYDANIRSMPLKQVCQFHLGHIILVANKGPVVTIKCIYLSSYHINACAFYYFLFK